MDSVRINASTWVPLIVGLLSTIVGLTGLVLAAHFNRRSLEQKQIEDHRREIYKKLNDFYGPCILNLQISRTFYSVLSKSQGHDFSVLRFFLEGNRFSGNDAELYEKINQITNRVDVLIQSNTGLVDKRELQKSLAVASAHFGIIDSAYRGTLEGEIDRFSGYTYPSGLIRELENEVHLLRVELDRINGLKSL